MLHIKNHWEDVKETKDCHSHDAELVVQKWPVNFDQLVSYMCTFQGWWYKGKETCNSYYIS